MQKKVLLAGESWQSSTTHAKGFDHFSSTEYATGHQFAEQALKAAGYEVTVMPSHLAATDFPFTMEEIQAYSCVILSDIGSNTLLLPPQTFRLGQRSPNRCDLIRDYVLAGGALLMVGGYLTFTGIDGKGRWGATSVQQVLPVELQPFDDRAEHPEGIVPKVEDAAHPVLAGLGGPWPFFLGYNKSTPKPGAQVPLTIGGDPLLALMPQGQGKSAVFASDMAPHWAPAEFTGWEGFGLFWKNLMAWLV